MGDGGGKRETPPRQKGKREKNPKVKGKREMSRMTFSADSHLTTTARTHARTETEIDFPVGSPAPNLRFITLKYSIMFKNNRNRSPGDDIGPNRWERRYGLEDNPRGPKNCSKNENAVLGISILGLAFTWKDLLKKTKTYCP